MQGPRGPNIGAIWILSTRPAKTERNSLRLIFEARRKPIFRPYDSITTAVLST